MTSNPKDENSKDEKVNKAIAIASGKGGTGKTVTALNLGMTIHKAGKHVVIIDADINDPNLGVNLGIYEPQVTINEVLEEKKSFIESLYIHSSGLRVIPASLSINFLNTNMELMGELINDLGGYTIVDCGPGLDNNVITALESSDEVIAVTNPIRSSISGCMRLIEVAVDLDKEVKGILVNNLTSKEISNEEIEQITGRPVLGEIPYDMSIDESIVNREPLVNFKPYSSASIAFKKIAYNLMEKEYKRPRLLKLKRIYRRLKLMFK